VNIINREKSPYSSNFYLEMVNPNIGIPLGLYRGVKSIHKFGGCKNISASGEFQEVWDGNGKWTVPLKLEDSENLQIKSSKASDTIIMRVEGLDEHGYSQFEEIALNGLDSVTLNKKWYRVFRAYNIGSVEFTGDVTIFKKDTDPTVLENIRAKVLKQNQQTMMAIWTVPKDSYALGIKWAITISRGGADREVDAAIRARVYGQVNRVKSSVSLGTQGGGTFVDNFEPYTKLDELTDIMISVVNATANNIAYSAFLDALIIPKESLA